MTTSTLSKKQTPSQRSALAAQRAAEHLGLEDQKLLAVALVEIAAEEVAASASFADRVRARYAALHQKPAGGQSSKQATGGRQGNAGTVKPKVATRRTPGAHVDIVAPLDPRSLMPLYGARLPAHLAEYSVQALSQMARLLSAEHGLKAPTQKSGKDALVAYIMRQVDG